VIAPARPPFTEFVDETSALLVDADATDDVAGALARLVGDASLRARLEAAARGRAAELSWESSAAIHVAHYQRLIAQAPEMRSSHV
jgi:glycosyltransferase involved in cell wall biosynthesis